MRFDKDIEKDKAVTRCESCPSRTGRYSKIQLVGSSLRSESLSTIDPNRDTLDIASLTVDDELVALVSIWNQTCSPAAAEHDSEVFQSLFEQNVGNCTKPEYELNEDGVTPYCTPVNRAYEQFMEINREA